MLAVHTGWPGVAHTPRSKAGEWETERDGAGGSPNAFRVRCASGMLRTAAVSEQTLKLHPCASNWPACQEFLTLLLSQAVGLLSLGPGAGADQASSLDLSL